MVQGGGTKMESSGHYEVKWSCKSWENMVVIVHMTKYWRGESVSGYLWREPLM